MFKNLLSLLTLLLVTSYQLQAQSTDSAAINPKPEPERHKWEVALNVWPVIRDIKAGEAGLMVRKHFVDDNDRKKAYRFTINNFRQSFNPLEGWSKKVAHHNSMNIAFGQEWQKQSGKFMMYYGGDVGTGFMWNRDVAFGGGITEDGQAYSYGRGNLLNIYGWVSGFMGAKYFVNNTLSFSIESNVFYRLIDDKRYTTYYDADNKVIDKNAGNFATLHQIVFQPISAFYFSYYFN